MSGVELLQSVQYVTAGERRFAVIDANDWEALLEWLETLEDVELARHALADLKAAGGDREAAGWLKWDDLRSEL
jgi:hypothetical protein